MQLKEPEAGVLFFYSTGFVPATKLESADISLPFNTSSHHLHYEYQRPCLFYYTEHFSGKSTRPNVQPINHLYLRGQQAAIPVHRLGLFCQLQSTSTPLVHAELGNIQNNQPLRCKHGWQQRPGVGPFWDSGLETRPSDQWGFERQLLTRLAAAASAACMAGLIS